MPKSYSRGEMELRHLRYFVAVAEEENVTRAAAKLHVSQPALSRQIRDLEAELGLSLLERTAKTVRLTAVGRAFLIEARAVLKRAEDAVKTARALASGIQCELRVGYAPSLTVEILPRALRALEAKCPGIRVVLQDLSTEEMLAQLHDDKLDLVLGVRPSAKLLRGLSFVELARYPLCVAVSHKHPLAQKRALTLNAISKDRLIGYDQINYPEYHERIDALFKSTVKPGMEEHGSVMSLIAEVEAGRGIALVPSCLECLAGPRLQLIPLNPSGPPIIAGAIVRKEKVSIAAKEFIAAASAPEMEEPPTPRERSISG
jgi:DNA-binding transcriptional LysR family regulator